MSAAVPNGTPGTASKVFVGGRADDNRCHVSLVSGTSKEACYKNYGLKAKDLIAKLGVNE